jgi:hypothetical protein
MLLTGARGIFAACLLFLFQQPSLRYDGGRNIFVLEHWPGAAGLPEEERPNVLRVSVDAPDVPPLLGRHTVEDGNLIFAPQFPLQPGVRYRAVAHIPAGAPVSTVIEIPRAITRASTLVDRIYPTTAVLAENHLKFYIHFSAPMSRGFAYDNVALLDQSGAAIDAPFLELGEELWDRENRRFTLFFDPGRIKRGLVSQQELGVALEEGKHYTLVIRTGWRDADGNPLAAEFRKSFTGGPADRKAINLKDWTIRRPSAGGRDPLTIVFPEPMDHALLLREVDVVDAAGISVAGRVTVGSGETSWSLIPDGTWKKGGYSVLVGAAAADLAGNMVGRPFEIDVFDRIDDSSSNTPHTLPFTID